MSTALYRRYRPESFADVIGQQHVTEPLMQALRADRTNHAYLFSGPRGCGKTTSARILARCLNCAQGPTDTPCGECESCRDLARGGGGSLDVVEIDAASHGGVDDARELRERAAIAPARDRFKIFIIDEAHMVTNQGFNALLKLVEEPPEHVKFVFATTEPDKVLPTIRSRTHHYPFHLVPPDSLGAYLESLSVAENVQVGAGVIPLVVRAGGGSVRDSLSILDQLMAGAGVDGIDHTRAAALLGYTEGPLLDDVITSLAARDGAALFTAVDRVLGSGQDPRRFVEDLLARLRDLIVTQALGERARDVLPGIPEDQLARLRQQASSLGAGELSRAGDVVADALADMVGASSPRIQLELVCARLLLPAADADGAPMARLDRIERRLAGAPGPQPVGGGAAPAAAHHQADPSPPPAPTADSGRPPAPAAAAAPAATAPVRGGGETPSDDVARPGQPATQVDPGPPAAPAEHGRASTVSHTASRPTPQQSQASAGQGEDSTDLVRRFWPDILSEVRGKSRVTWSMVGEHAQVMSSRDGVLTLGFQNTGALTMFRSRSSHGENVAQAVNQVAALRVSVEAVPFGPGGGGADPASPGPSVSGPTGPGPSGPGPSDPDGGGPGGPGGVAGGDPAGPRDPTRHVAPAPQRQQAPQERAPHQQAPQGHAPRQEPPHGQATQRPAQPASSTSPPTAPPAPPPPEAEAGGWPAVARPPGSEQPSDAPPAGSDRPRVDQPLVDQAQVEQSTADPRSGADQQPGTDGSVRNGHPQDRRPPEDQAPANPAAPPATPTSRQASSTVPPTPGADPGRLMTDQVEPPREEEVPPPPPEEPSGWAVPGEEPGAPNQSRRPAEPVQQRRSRAAALLADMERRQQGEGDATAPQRPANAEDLPSADDEDAADSGLVGPSVVEKLLGGKVIDEQPTERG